MTSFADTLATSATPAIQWGVVIGASLVAAVTDARQRRISNGLTGPVFLLGLVHAFLVGGPAGLADGFASALLLALPYVLLFVFAGGGAGDAKLMGAIGAWLGLALGAATLVSVCLAGIALAVVWARREGRLRAVLADLSVTARSVTAPMFGVGSLKDIPDALPDVTQGQKMPYGLAICAGVLVSALIHLA